MRQDAPVQRLWPDLEARSARLSRPGQPGIARCRPDRARQAGGGDARILPACRRGGGEDLIWIARAQGATAGLRYEPPMGAGPILHATATGKAWLASLPEVDALRIAFSHGFDGEGRTRPNALTGVDALRSPPRRGAAARLRHRGRGGRSRHRRDGDDVSRGPRPRHGDRRDAERRRSLAAHAGRAPAIAEALKRAAQEMAEIWPLRQAADQPVTAAGETRHMGASA